MTTRFAVSAGRDSPLGVTLTEAGANVAVFSEHATSVEICLFSEDGTETTRRLPERLGHVWFGHIADIRAGQIYGLRVHGPFKPEEGHRFNPAKLLIDPYARELTGPLEWHEVQGGGISEPDARDSASLSPKCIVPPNIAPYSGPRPKRAWQETVIYEAHPAGLTRQWPGLADLPPLEALTAEPVLAHLQALGITAIELLPCHAFMSDRFLVERDLQNYWGYQSIGFFAPHPDYLAGSGPEAFAAMVRRFHEAGIEVLLDVVYNHSAEGDAGGPTIAFRGLDNANYYRLLDDRSAYDNLTGTGNALATDHPMVQRLILDSLRYWVEYMGVDGFRFDLGATLGREKTGFDPGAGLLDAIRQDPVLRSVMLIVEPWDIGPGGYQLGNFPHPFAEWNDKFRDSARRFWRGDADAAADLAGGLLGSARAFDHSGRAATASVNLITAHDGFTLADLTAFNNRHNEANREEGRDGHGANYSDNLGHEGPVEDAAIRAARSLRRKNLLATLFLAQGTPMLLAGDEVGNSQGGNNNAYAQGNPIGWVTWNYDPLEDLTGFVAELSALRRRYPVLSQSLFLHANPRSDGTPDLRWWRRDGHQMTAADWQDPNLSFFAFELRSAAEAPDHAQDAQALFVVINRSDACTVRLPTAEWDRVLETSPAENPMETGVERDIAASCVAVFAERL